VDVIDAVETMLKAFASGLTEQARLDFVDQLVWTLDDNGDALFAARERWAIGEDASFASLAMSQWCSPIGSSLEEAERIVGQAVTRWPELQTRGMERLNEWTGVGRGSSAGLNTAET
jgi:hypothetical protein